MLIFIIQCKTYVFTPNSTESFVVRIEKNVYV